MAAARRGLVLAALGIVFAAQSFGAAPHASEEFAKIAGGQFDSVLPIAPGQNRVAVKSFLLDRVPVTNAAFARFVKSHPEWRRDRIGALFADGQYLSQWASADSPGAKIALQPVVRVSWFAAQAYCRARGARLPTWYEWEYAAAASATSRDARQDPKWRQQILDWYARPAGELEPVGSTPANFYGIRDLHGVVWEWVDDYMSLMVSADNREQGDPNVARFCGAGALTLEEKEQYAVLMRIAMLSSLEARYTTGALGFRCAADTKEP